MHAQIYVMAHEVLCKEVTMSIHEIPTVTFTIPKYKQSPVMAPVDVALAVQGGIMIRAHVLFLIRFFGFLVGSYGASAKPLHITLVQSEAFFLTIEHLKCQVLRLFTWMMREMQNMQ